MSNYIPFCNLQLRLVRGSLTREEDMLLIWILREIRWRRQLISRDWPPPGLFSRFVQRRGFATPIAGALAKAGVSLEELDLMTKEQILEIQQIGPRSAHVILQERQERQELGKEIVFWKIAISRGISKRIVEISQERSCSVSELLLEMLELWIQVFGSKVVRDDLSLSLFDQLDNREEELLLATLMALRGKHPFAKKALRSFLMKERGFDRCLAGVLAGAGITPARLDLMTEEQLLLVDLIGQKRLDVILRERASRLPPEEWTVAWSFHLQGNVRDQIEEIAQRERCSVGRIIEKMLKLYLKLEQRS